MALADIIQSIVGLILALGAACGVGYGVLQKKKYKKEQDQKIQTLMESAHELAKAKVDSKSIDSLIADSNKRYGPAVADKPEKK